MASSVKVPIFADCNLGTHIAVDVSPDIKAGDLKRELEEAHLNCFPKFGEVRVNGLMVKRKLCFYHLPDPLPIKHVFQGFRGIWFVHIEAFLVSEIRNRASNASHITSSAEPTNHVSSSNKCFAKKRGMETILCPDVVPTLNGLERCHVSTKEGRSTKEPEHFASRSKSRLIEERNSGAISKNYSEAFSEAVSVSGIIKKYFCDYGEVTSFDFTSRANQSQCNGQLKAGITDNCSKKKVKGTPQFVPKTPPRMLNFPLATDLSLKISRSKFGRTEVGKRLLMASDNLGNFKSKQKSSVGLYRCKDHKSSVPSSSSIIRSLVFEISDDDE